MNRNQADSINAKMNMEILQAEKECIVRHGREIHSGDILFGVKVLGASFSDDIVRVYLVDGSIKEYTNDKNIIGNVISW